MEFFILQNENVTFSGPPIPTHTGLLKRAEYTPCVEIQQTSSDDGTQNWSYSGKLHSAIIQNPWHQQHRETTKTWCLKVAVYLPDPLDGKAGKSGDLKVYVRKDEDGSVENFLEVLHNTFNVEGGDGGNNMTVNVVVKNFGLRKKSRRNPAPITWKANGLALEDVVRPNMTFVECNYKPLLPKPGNRMLKAWKNGEEFSAVVTISLVLNSSALSLLNSMNLVPEEGFGHLKNMLEKEIYTDLKILVGAFPDQKVVKCHRGILAARSKVFQRMFERGMEEARGCKIEIEEMSEKGVRALLAYLYYRDMKAAYESCEIALELLQAGEKYQINGLKVAVREYMMAVGSGWFGVDMVLELYDFAKALWSKPEPEEEEETENSENETIEGDVEMSPCCLCGRGKNEAWKSLKNKCLKVIKWYRKKKTNTLWDSVKYQEIYGGRNRKLGREIDLGISKLD